MTLAIAEKTKNKHIIGSVYVSNKEAAADAFVRQRLYYSFTENGLKFLVTSGTKWSDNHITFNHSSASTGTIEEALQIITSLKAVMNTEDALKLGIKGRFSIVIDKQEEPLVFRVEINGGEVSYQQAEYNWPEKIVV